MASSEPTPSSTPTMFSISLSTPTPAAWHSATTSRVSSQACCSGRSEASNSTEVQPCRITSVMTARSGQWSRCNATGTDALPAACWKIPEMISAPMLFTVLTEVCRMIGDWACSAAAMMARIDRSSTMLTAATAYPALLAATTRSTVLAMVMSILRSGVAGGPARLASARIYLRFWADRSEHVRTCIVNLATNLGGDPPNLTHDGQEIVDVDAEAGHEQAVRDARDGVTGRPGDVAVRARLGAAAVDHPSPGVPLADQVPDDRDGLGDVAGRG